MTTKPLPMIQARLSSMMDLIQQFPLLPHAQNPAVRAAHGTIESISQGMIANQNLMRSLSPAEQQKLVRVAADLYLPKTRSDGIDFGGRVTVGPWVFNGQGQVRFGQAGQYHHVGSELNCRLFLFFLRNPEHTSTADCLREVWTEQVQEAAFSQKTTQKVRQAVTKLRPRIEFISKAVAAEYGRSSPSIRDCLPRIGAFNRLSPDLLAFWKTLETSLPR